MAELDDRVRRLLEGNRVVAGGRWRYTRPAQRTYPHQWLWDSCFHARIHHWLGDRAMAHDELVALFRAQETDGPDAGRLPRRPRGELAAGRRLLPAEPHGLPAPVAVGLVLPRDRLGVAR